jgi:hydrogenase expression/formation protein HypE
MDNGSYRIQAILFDFDGTLTRPGALDFSAIKAELGCPLETPVLEYIRSLNDERARRAAVARLDTFETAGAAASQPNPGAEDLIGWLRARAVAIGILTRNSLPSVRRALENFHSVRLEDFDLVISRDDPVDPKPSGDGIVLAARRLGISPEQILMVGDYVLDAQAGRAAGAITVLLDPRHDPILADVDCDFRIRQIEELMAIVNGGLPLAAGKLPNEMLQAFLEEFHVADPSVLVDRGVGEDVAAVDVGPADVLVLKSDPITFATDALGHYAALVNANDIATSGATPRWFLTTLLLPCGTVPSEVRRIMGELAAACARWNITLCGGHTEITDAVRRPLVIGMMAGTVARRHLIHKKGMRPDDCVLITKAVAVEGTAVITREFGRRLQDLGFESTEIEEGRRFLDRIGIIEEARLAAGDSLASAMHDVTEGGVATALWELSVAGGHAIHVALDQIPVYDLTRRICAALDLDPLGLIGSGSLLICCRPENCEPLMGRLASAGIAVTRIGTVGPRGSGVIAHDRDQPVDWPGFEVDEITRLFQ